MTAVAHHLRRYSRTLSRTCGLVLAGVSAWAAGADFSVNPLWVMLDTQTRSAQIEIRNHAEQPVRFQIRGAGWTSEMMLRSSPGRWINAINPFLTTSVPLIDSVAEHASTTIQQSFLFHSILMIFAGLGIWLIIKNYQTKNSSFITNDMILFSLIFGLIGIYVSSAFVRLEVFASLSLIILSSLGLSILIKEILNNTENKKLKNLIINFSFLAGILILLIIPISFPTTGNWVTAAKTPPTILNGGTAYAVSTNDWFDTELRHLGLGLLQYALGDLFASKRDHIKTLRLFFLIFQADLGSVQLPVGPSHGFDQPMRGDEVTHGRIDDVVQAVDGVEAVVDRLEKLYGVDDLPAGEGIHPDECLVQRRNLSGLSIPFLNVFREKAGLFDEGHFELEPRFQDGISHNPAELSDHHLLGFTDHETRFVQDDHGGDQDDD